MRPVRLAKLASVAAFLAATPALAQVDAQKRFDGKSWCGGNNVSLHEWPDGTLRANFLFKFGGDVTKATYGVGTAPLFNGSPQRIAASLQLQYTMHLDRSGKPLGRPKPLQLSYSPGTFTARVPQPFSSLGLRLGNGADLADPFPIEQENWDSLAILSSTAIRADDPSPGTATPVKPEALERPVLAMEKEGARAIVVFQNGREIARVPLVMRPLRPEFESMVTWVRKAAPLLVQGKCPA